jgi:hypothetical protein
MNAPTIVGAERVDVHADIGGLLPNGDDREPAVLLAALEEISPLERHRRAGGGG